MAGARVRFDGVWKKFRRGQRHDSLRDLVPAAFRALTRRHADMTLDAEEFWAVKDVSFSVGPGDALGIIGRNGAGKSTVLKLLTRILKPTRGSCQIVGRAGALIEIAAGFHQDLTGRENIYLQGAVMGMRRAEIVSRFDEIVDFAGIGSFVDTPIKRYSSGMNARLGFSIAAHLRPEVLLVDEVLAVGDRAFQEKCYERMKRFRTEGVAIVFVSHHLPAVADLCDRVLLLDRGEPVLLGGPSAVIGAYCSGGGTTTHDGVSIAADLVAHHPDHKGPVWDVQPGARLDLKVTLDFHVDIDRATVGVVIWDLTRELYVYGASSDSVGIPPIVARRGDQRHFVFSVQAHLTRGLYAIEVNVFDQASGRFLGLARGIRHFHVVERVSYDGVANLYLSGHEAPSLAAGSELDTVAVQ